jgi:hypothetical protein
MSPLAALITLLTSAGLAVVAIAVFRLPLRALPSALARSLEVIGAVVLFSAANVVLGMVLVLVLRRIDAYYFSLYEAADVAVLGLSFSQAIVFYAWRGAAGRA